ncbi:MAG TPA: division/cell wall cluster transcriptional repressor MraZ [Castellaniella sp.]|jgi:MraZ protein|uniref:division/cell wall cluster transcriptional repressor MraZ n=1 Tax=Castellaniella sp. TaxID=1955812 RepID=UPI0012096CED|nr:division/cell wall cluster transcriptional repressor MraZ [Castellaniella sp.]TAN31220.1 MAG: transcriptional regulator MraZ [Castellaniella sp.]HEX2518118.1 division/cell wall cluster transcriptional repressor MraZ [Castellaniella sp.]
MFQGSSALTLDAKGRMSIPARHRDVLLATEEGRLTLTRHPDGCLMLYPRSIWETKREQIAALPASARALQRLLLGSAQDVEMDGAGRILVSPELRAAAGLEREVMLLGLGSNFELWDRPTWEARSIDDVNKLDASILEQISF